MRCPLAPCRSPSGRRSQKEISTEYMDISSTPGVIGGHQAASGDTATTVRLQDGRTLATGEETYIRDVYSLESPRSVAMALNLSVSGARSSFSMGRSVTA